MNWVVVVGGFALVVAGACSNTDLSDAGAGGRGGSAGDASGGNDPNGGGDGGNDEPTPLDICEEFICPPDGFSRDFGDNFCPPPGDAGGESGNMGTAVYDREACMELCLVYPDLDVPPQCGDESYLYWKCLGIESNWICLPTGGTEEHLCHHTLRMLASCIAAYAPYAASGESAR